jgi:hypothetical protein
MRCPLTQRLSSESSETIMGPMSGLAHAAQSRHLRDAFVDLRIVANHAAAEISSDGSGGNGIDRNAAPAKFLCQITGQHLDRALHRCVRSASGKRNARQSRRDVHDATAVVEKWQERLRQKEDPFEMDVVEAVQFLFGRLLNGVVVRRAGVVDKIVEAIPAKSGKRGSHIACEGGERTSRLPC